MLFLVSTQVSCAELRRTPPKRPARLSSSGYPQARSRLVALAMGNNYVFSLQPTFTQGLILGQLSILLLLGLILKYLFIDSSESSVEAFSYHPRLDNKTPVGPDYYRFSSRDSEEEVDSKGSESADWFNIILQQVRFVLLM